MPAVHADMNEELLVSTSDQLVLNMSLRVVHTARRCYRWCRRRDLFSWVSHGFSSEFPLSSDKEAFWKGRFECTRGSKSRNKVAGGEPPAGSVKFGTNAFCRSTGKSLGDLKDQDYKEPLVVPRASA